MKKNIYITLFIASIFFSSCNTSVEKYDATGQFEVTEITISAKVDGELLDFNIEEGFHIKAGESIGYIDTTQLHLEKMQLIAKMQSISYKICDISKQIASNEERIRQAKVERTRNEKLVTSNAGTQKGLDDMNHLLKILQKELYAKKADLENNNNSINHDIQAINIQIEQINDKIKNSIITAPIDGTVLYKYIEEHELASKGKALLKIADVQKMFLRAYITSSQLSQIKLNDKVVVHINMNVPNPPKYEGVLTWIADQAEFTPKTIQTIDERENLVYAIKILVKNDGFLKSGMYGDVQFANKSTNE